MKISIITPDHRGRIPLQATLDSVIDAVHYLNKHQPASEPTVEWLVGRNGDALEGGKWFKPGEYNDFEIREIMLPPTMDGNVGALKKALCDLADGDYMLELDSDDMLSDLALLELVNCIEELGNPDFVFSDAVRVTDKGDDYTFGGNCGWETAEHGGRKYNPTPQVSAANMYKILHAPDHFRCWRKDFYEAIGGHDETLKVCDDFDLLQRTYLKGSMAQIHQPLYQYTVQTDGSNTWLQNVKLIQSESRRLGDSRIHELIQRESALTGKKILELGGKKGTRGRHTIAFTGSDQNCDLRAGIPMEANSCVAVYCQDVLEHFDTCSGIDCNHARGECVVGIMNEIHRVLIPGGMLIANTPSTNGDGAWGDPSHRSGWNMWSVNYYTEKVQAGFLGQETGVPTCKFIRHRAYEWFPTQWHTDNNLKYLHMVLGALKPGAMGHSTLR